MWKQTTRHEANLRIWQEELEDFVPRRILDFHVHIFDRASLRSGHETWSCAGHPISHYDFDDFTEDLADAYPGRQTLAVCFGLPEPKQFDQHRNDAYVAAGCDRKRFFALRLIDPAEDPDAVRRDIQQGGFVGLKPYPRFVPKADVNQVEICEMLPAPIMRVADELGLVIMLHIPRAQRLADPLNQRQLVELCQSYPNARIVLAHIGRAYYLKNIVGNLHNLRALPNLYYDLTMVNHWEVMEYLFQTVAPHKIIFGTDIPIALAPGKSVEINDQYTYVTPVPWELSICDIHRKLVFTSFLYEQIRAIKKAVQRCGLGRDFVEGVFYSNGMKLLTPWLAQADV